MTTATQISSAWNNLDQSDKLDRITEALENYAVNEGFLMIRVYNNGDVTCHIQKHLDNHLCVEAVSQATLAELFGSEDYEYQEGDAEIILNWMEAQN